MVKNENVKHLVQNNSSRKYCKNSKQQQFKKILQNFKTTVQNNTATIQNNSQIQHTCVLVFVSKTDFGISDLQKISKFNNRSSKFSCFSCNLTVFKMAQIWVLHSCVIRYQNEFYLRIILKVKVFEKKTFENWFRNSANVLNEFEWI